MMAVFRRSPLSFTTMTRLLHGALARQVALVVLPFGLQQGIRLATNIVLAALLAPEMFGIMVLVNTLRTGTELLSDIGIGQSVVRSRQASDVAFLNTAWTLQLCRGVALMLLMLCTAIPVAGFYNQPDFAAILAVVSLTFLLTGLQSPAIFVIQREMRLKQRAAYDLTSTVVQCGLTIMLAFIWPSVWALVFGLVLSTLFSTILSYCFRPRKWPRLCWQRDHVFEIIKFGKWIFLSTAIYFAAISTDKIYLASVLPLALVGIYGVARTFADMLAALSQRVGSFLVFPKVAGLRQREAVGIERFRHLRRKALLLVAAALGTAIATSDGLILLLYDQRYHAAAFMLPILLAGVWFSVLANFADATLVGLDRPSDSAMGNLAKFVALAIGLPLAIGHSGLLLALFAIAFADAARWLWLSISLRRQAMPVLRDDLFLTAIVVGLAAGMKYTLGSIGLVPDFAEWWTMGSALHG